MHFFVDFANLGVRTNTSGQCPVSLLTWQRYECVTLQLIRGRSNEDWTQSDIRNWDRRATAARRKVLSDICLVHLAPLKQDLKAKFSALHRQDRESICPAKRQHRAKDESRSSTARHASQNLQLFNAKATQRSRNFGHASN